MEAELLATEKIKIIEQADLIEKMIDLVSFNYCKCNRLMKFLDRLTILQETCGLEPKYTDDIIRINEIRVIIAHSGRIKKYNGSYWDVVYFPRDGKETVTIDYESLIKEFSKLYTEVLSILTPIIQRVEARKQ